MPFVRDDHDSGLDFFLPRSGIYIEIKAFHSPRIADQMSRRSAIIVAQGSVAIGVLCAAIRSNPLAF